MLAAAEAVALGHGGVSQISRACGLSRVTILHGIRDLAEPALPEGRVRRAGGDRKSLVIQDPALPQVLESLVEPLARGDPESPLRWTCKSTRTLARELTTRQHPISHEKVAQLLRGLD
jgi:Rhodopirellula transposase DDE domain